MYSPNGTGCRLTYSCGGPDAGLPDDRGVRQEPGRPLQHGADQGGHADGVHRVVDDLAGVGLLVRVEVGGVLRPDDDVRPRRRPRGDPAASSAVTRAWLSRTARRSALKSRPASGTSPWIPATRVGVPPVGQRDEQSGRRHDHGEPGGHAADRAGRRLAGRGGRAHGAAAQQDQHGGAQGGTAPGDREGHQRRAAEEGQPDERRVGLGEREPSPREAAERRPVAQRLLRRPEPGEHRGAGERPARPPLGAGDRPRRRCRQQREVRRLQHAQRQPGHGTDVDPAPVQQRDEEGEAVEQAQARRDERPAARDGQDPAAATPTTASGHHPGSGKASRVRKPPTIASRAATTSGTGARRPGFTGPR